MNKNSDGNLQLSKILRLQSVRIRRYEREMFDKRNAYLESDKKVKQRESEIQNIHQTHSDLNNYRNSEGVLSSPNKMDLLKIKRYWLNYDLEMHEYYHQGEVSEKDEANQEYLKSRNIWLKEKLKSHMMETLQLDFSAQVEDIQDD
ncbi:MAG: hypothetical protein P8179_19235 [Candidatus Thiodiazotropha sp.]|jgi:hypothetical protein